MADSAARAIELTASHSVDPRDALVCGEASHGLEPRTVSRFDDDARQA
jgi:hypothetical protein